MTSPSDQVVVLQGDATKWYSQAVFILNPSPQAEPAPVDFVAEAEKIIFSYVARKRKYAKDGIHAFLDYTPPVILPVKSEPILIEKMDKMEKRRFWETPLFYIVTIGGCLALGLIFALGWLR